MHVQKIRELESVNHGSPGGTWADTGGNGGAGVGGDDARVLELQATVTALRNKLESTEITLAEERSRHQQVFFLSLRKWFVNCVKFLLYCLLSVVHTETW